MSSSSASPAPSGSGSETAPPTRRLRLGWLGPAVLAAWLALDLVLRVFPVEQLGVSPISAAQRFTGRHSPFRANVSITVPAGSPGENAIRGNLPPTERRPPLRFSTDALGYRRNPEIPPAVSPEILVLGGDSFVFGANLSDEETLPAALTRASGLTAYNAGRSYQIPMKLQDLDWLLSKFRRLPGKAVLIHLEHQRWRSWDRGLSFAPGLVDDVKYVRWLWNGWWGASPLSNATRRLFRRLSDDRILANVYEENILARTLPDGRPILFRDTETLPARVEQTGATIASTADYLAEWTRQLEGRGLETLVLLLPTRYTIYGTFVEEGELRAGVLRARRDLYALETLLGLQGVKTVNGLRVFERTAEADIASGNLPFYREDNHWTPEGAERIARILADSLLSNSAHTTPLPSAVLERGSPERNRMSLTDAF